MQFSDEYLWQRCGLFFKLNRQELGLTIEQAARILERSTEYTSSLEMGNFLPTKTDLKKLREIYQFTIEEFQELAHGDLSDYIRDLYLPTKFADQDNDLE